MDILFFTLGIAKLIRDITMYYQTQSKTFKSKSSTIIGFTLIEMMIVVAIIGIVATMAIVTYKRNIANAQVSEAMTLLSAARSAVEDKIAQDGSFPTDAELNTLSVRQVGEFVSDITSKQATNTLFATFGPNTSSLISGKELHFERDSATGDWYCKITSSTIADSVLPRVCD